MKNFLKTKIFIYSAVSIVYLLMNSLLLMNSPRPWPDEAIYADIAITYLREQRLATDLWKDMIPGVDKIAAWNPPAYFLLTAAAFKLFPQTLLTQRILSATAGFLVILLVLEIMSQLIPQVKKRYLWLLAVGLLLDYQFMVATRIARPEIFALLFGFVAWWLLLHWTKEKRSLHWQKSLLIGLISGFAGLFHPLGISMAVIGGSYWLFNRRDSFKIVPFTLGVVLPLSVWLFSIYPFWSIMLTQFQLAAIRKNLEDPWLIIAFKQHIIRYMIFFVSVGISLSCLVYVMVKQIKVSSLIVWLTGICLFFALLSVWGRMMWYIVYPIPFLYIAMIFILDSKKFNVIVSCCLAALLLTNGNLTLKEGFRNITPTKAYSDYCAQILRVIPDKVPVFLSAVPEPYYCFKNRNNQLIEFPVLSLSKAMYQMKLNQADYVVYQGSYETVLFGNFLQQYLKLNSKDEFKSYNATIIELRPKDQRLLPGTDEK